MSAEARKSSHDRTPRRSGELELSDADFKLISDTLYREAGIVLPDTKRSMVYSRLAKRLRLHDLDNFSDYCKMITSGKEAEEMREFVFALTTNVTSFFRESHHFEMLRNQILPGLIERAQSGGRVRIWSAGCSNGQEVYSIAATLLSMMPNASNFDVRLLATDIDEKMVEHGRKGQYDKDLIDPVPDALKKKFFSPVTDDPEKVEVTEPMKKLVTFKPMNLIRPWPVKGPFDVIFCRNVVIYFDDQTKARLWQQFSQVLDRDGWMMIGHSERIGGPAMDQFQSVGLTAYRRN